MTVAGQWVITASITAELLPAVVVAATGTSDPARRWIAAAFAFWFAEDCLLWWTAAHHVNNHWLVHIGNPVGTALVLMAYAFWMGEPVRQRALRIAAAVYFAVWAGLFLAIENSDTFSQYTDPLQALVLILVCAYTLMRAVGAAAGPVWRRAEFWVSVGLLLDFGTGLLLSPVSGVLAKSDPSLVVSAYVAKAGINTLAYLLVTTGMLCPPSPLSIGVFSSRQVSPS